MFALADCNNFYCSCERLFRPDLAKRPVVVLSNNDGCAIARSEEAKAVGIQMGTPAFMINDLIKKHGVAVFSSNYTLYGDISQRVQTVYQSYVRDIEEYSIDESFLHLFDYAGVDLYEYAKQIRSTVKRNIGIPICIGLAPTKALAKAANRYAKKCHREVGVFVMDSDEKRKEVLQWLEVGDVWGIGRQNNKWLLEHGIKSAWELSQANEAWIRSKMGVVGVRLVKELNGISCLELEMIPPLKQEICTSRSFGQLITEKEDLQQAIATFTQRCAEKLRRQKSSAGAIQVFSHTNPHRAQDKQYHGVLCIPLLQATNNTAELLHYAKIAADAIYRKGIKFMKAGVILMDLVPDSEVQGSLFGNLMPSEKKSKAMQALDGLNTKFGRDTIRYASAGYGTKWKLRNQYQSPLYTTNIKQAPRVTLSHVQKRQDTSQDKLKSLDW